MLRSIRARAKRENVPRILILGLDNAGKTTILKKLSDEDPQQNEGPTQGFNLKSLNLSGRNANLCDLGGQRSYREFWSNYYESSDCLIFVVDSTDSRRMEETLNTFNEVLENLPKVPVLVFANKQDLQTAKSPATIAEVLELVEHRERKWHIQGCSAKTGDGIEDGIAWLMTAC
uniref:ADP-ribosylation factor-like protein 3 n=1 Tax=Neobodo designis TaxID=312471 RepID=A0A7S1LYA6_NEODS|mmetsp:Transcript_30736/g.94965  ORF Transcript_30736/g.94965 Transcript_30736/m.94965 type:complete len:174 (+) Transcript_30736:46-567(+)|eukprot:CAMPEP_0174850276 /NCGR_PEP_ID=MMETSP1114-20130205/19141_1 /TAXON_ID=312471 /ORGANISM="Neobodo designis, Strain CCAP 1951/1" /LENGTH=173 /DNA_ID=CAMNT_0016084723 /DNA_START=46 /DNA_END=567 /DNA_ORIENTATION=-